MGSADRTTYDLNKNPGPSDYTIKTETNSRGFTYKYFHLGLDIARGHLRESSLDHQAQGSTKSTWKP